MLTRGQFAERVLQKISTACDAEHWPENSLPIETAGVGVFVRYESEWAFNALWNSLQDMLDDDSELTEEPLREMLRLLRDRWSIISNTDCIPNHSMDTLASRAYVILAKELNAVLNQEEDSEKSIYHYLFPELPESAYIYRSFTADYISHLLNEEVNSQGVELYEGEKYEDRSIEDLSLAEFIWSDPHKPNIKDESNTVAPIVLLASIDAFLERMRKGNKTDSFPQHTAQSVLLSNSMSPVLLTSESSRIYLHSTAAMNYLNAVKSLMARKEDQMSLADIAKCREVFVQELRERRINPKSKFDNSDGTLLRKGWLAGAAQNITDNHLHQRGAVLPIYSVQDPHMDIWILADFMNERIRKTDWREFIEKLAVTDDFLSRLTIPTVNQKQDLSIFEDVRFPQFVNNCFGLSDDNSSFADYCSNNAASSGFATALLFILAELYKRHRASATAGKYTGMFSHATDGMVGSSRTQKTNACHAFQDFLVDPKYMLDQFKRYCRDKGREKTGYEVLDSGRTKFLLDMAILHGPGLNQKMQTLKSLAETLVGQSAQKHGDAGLVSNRENWKQSLGNIETNSLLAIAAPNDPNVGESEAFRKLVGNYKNYELHDELYNRAALFVMAEIYLLKRTQEGTNTSSFTSWIAFGKSEKVKAVEAFQAFLSDASGKFKLNQFAEYCDAIRHPEYVKTMEDYITAKLKGSDTAVMIRQATDVCDKRYFQDQRVKAKADLRKAHGEQSLRMSPNY